MLGALFFAHSEEPSTRDVRSTQNSRGRKNTPSPEEDHRLYAATQEDLRRRTPENTTSARRFASRCPAEQAVCRKDGAAKTGAAHG